MLNYPVIFLFALVLIVELYYWFWYLPRHWKEIPGPPALIEMADFCAVQKLNSASLTGTYYNAKFRTIKCLESYV